MLLRECKSLSAIPQICWSARFPNVTEVDDSPSFPLTGSAHLKLLLQKTDSELNGYQLRYSLQYTEVSGRHACTQLALL